MVVGERSGRGTGIASPDFRVFLFFFCGCLAQSISLGCIFPVSTADGIGWLFWFSVRFDIPFRPPSLLLSFCLVLPLRSTSRLPLARSLAS